MSEPVANINGVAVSEGNMDKQAQKWVSIANHAHTELAPLFRMVVEDRGIGTVAEITEPGVLKTLTDDTVIERDFLIRYGNFGSANDIRNNLYKRWRAKMRAMSSVRADEIKPFHFKSDPPASGWAWQRLLFDPIEKAEIPEIFKVLLSYTTEDEARSVVLFIGSMFDYESTRHQYLYLHGLGSDGKSTLLKAMYAMFNNHGYTTMQGNSLDDSHATADLEGVRLLVFPDCNRPSLPSTGNFKEITGEDMVGVNPKLQARRNIKMHCKVVISSNDEPQLAGGRADERRIIPVTFRGRGTLKSDEAWKQAFVASAPQIAQYCISEYRAWRKDYPNEDLPAAASAMEMVRENSTEATASDLVDRLFDFSKPEAFIRNSVLADTLKHYTRGEDRLMKQCYKVLKARGYASKTKREGEETFKGWKGVSKYTTVVLE